MAELSEEAKKAIKDEFREFMYENQKTLDELDLYKWVIRALFVLLLGGSIVGIYKFQDYLDDRIATRIEKFDDVYLANILSASSENRNALEQIGNFFDKLSDGSKVAVGAKTQEQGFEQDLSRASDLSKAQRDFFFVTLLDAVAYINDMGIDDNYVGKSYWIALIKNRYFQRDFVLAQRWEANQKFNNRMANAYARFAENIDDVRQSKRYFEAALSAATLPLDKAQNCFGLTFISLVLDNLDSAVTFTIEGNRHRANYINSEQIVTSIDYVLYERLWRKFHKSAGFQAAYEALFKRAASVEAERAIREKLEKVKVADRNFDEWQIIAQTQAVFEETLKAFLRDDKSVLAKNVAPSAFQSLSSDMNTRRELGQKIHFGSLKVVKSEISDVQDSSNLSIKFTTEQVSWLMNSNGDMEEGGTTAPWNQVAVWSFHRAPGGAWRVVSMSSE